ncbi:MAG TPA: hypothetical protein VEA44_06210, partial [Caulobacter sp.]|nr:hypothetical protein [Caulobacter sp.]
DLEEQVRATFESLAEGKFEDCSRATPRLARLAHNPAFGETDVELRQLASRRAILSRPAVVAAIDRTGRRVTTPFAGRYYPE